MSCLKSCLALSCFAYAATVKPMEIEIDIPKDLPHINQVKGKNGTEKTRACRFIDLYIPFCSSFSLEL